jgi:hypothetical protein
VNWTKKILISKILISNILISKILISKIRANLKRTTPNTWKIAKEMKVCRTAREQLK